MGDRTIENLSFSYGAHSNVFDNQSFSLPSTGIVELRGANGSGKTTLLKLLGGVLKSHNQTLELWRRRTRALLFDDSLLSPDLLKVGEFQTVIECRFGLVHDGAASLTGSLPKDALLSTLSLGQRKRLVLDTALRASSECAVLLDEPLNGLDAYARERFLDEIEQCATSSLFVIASHEALSCSNVAIEIDVAGQVRRVEG